ncbi:MAG: polyprenyl synthetase family protein [Lactobacillaceae bacterium]|jgi:farnesyl diphosphate synthase|nr:polyprenyl synthetase family protein [Lactobacillaceae bacterium]
MENIQEIIKGYSDKFNSNLLELFNTTHGYEKKTVEAMLYSLTNGGKRLRAFLVFETAKLFGIQFEKSFRVSAALEMIHAYSLIHDDLPAMDNDVMRRGKPTCHIQFDEATAILAGDGLLTYSFEILSDKKTHENPEIRCNLIQRLANAAGAYNGMIAGQTLDLYADNCPKEQKNESLIKHIEEMKTGRLIRFACEAGTILGQANEEQFKALIKYARNIGMAFQIADDILDAEGDPKLVGKTLQKDKDQGKVTFVTLYGIDNAKETANQLINEAKNTVDIFKDKAKNLKLLADYIINRKY